MIAAGLLVILSVFSLALGAPSPYERRHVVRTVKDLPKGFAYFGKANQEQTLTLRISLVQSNVTGLGNALYDISNPSSKNYRQHLSKAEVEAMVAPSAASSQKVRAWLKNNGITPQTLSAAGDWLSIKVPVSKANALLDANFNAYTYGGSNATMLRTLAYSVPESLKGHLAFIYPTTQFIAPMNRPLPAFQAVDSPRRSKGHSRRASVPKDCNTQITPKCLQAMYNIPTTLASADGNSLTVTGFLDEIPNKGDLTDFLSAFSSNASPDFDVAGIDGGTTDTSQPGTLEASLDIQYAIGLAKGVPTNFVSVGNNFQDGDLEGYLDLANFLLKQDDLPLVLSTSYGFNENFFDGQSELPVNLCNLYAQFGARGTTLVFSSGDGGVSGSAFQRDDTCDTFVPTFPSSCPFVTSVGSTQGIKEVAADFSGGGFSNVFRQPAYQADAVSTYLDQLGDTNDGFFNPRGRAFPDVSTQGVNFLVNIGGQTQSISGTSASAPTFASIVALLNDELLSRGQPSVGFLNPLLYASGASAFNDITQGSNPGCGTDGFPAAEGWDPVTGLGTPDFNKLLQLVTSN